jgi:hypothetical protein
VATAVDDGEVELRLIGMAEPLAVPRIDARDDDDPRLLLLDDELMRIK